MASKGASLHIGLNAVDPKHYAGWSGELVACEADAGDMAAIAEARQYGKITRLLTAKATRKQVIDEIAGAAKTLQRGDTFFLTYSGHGGQIPDQNDEEPDRLYLMPPTQTPNHFQVGKPDPAFDAETPFTIGT